jgi:hypothetical protein
VSDLDSGPKNGTVKLDIDKGDGIKLLADAQEKIDDLLKQ